MDVVGAWGRHAREHFTHHVLRRHALHPQLRAENEAVSQRGDSDRLHVVREDVVPACECSPTARELEERQRVERERVARTKGSDQTSTELRAMLDSPIQQGGVGLDVHAAAFKGTARNASVAIAIEVDATRLKFTPPEGNGVFANIVELLSQVSPPGQPATFGGSNRVWPMLVIDPPVAPR